MVAGPERLAAIAAALDTVGLPYLVMGGHAVRYYGVDRNTIDYDLHVSLPDWNELPNVLIRASLFADPPPVEGSSWRPHSFRRFQIGRLPDGREEWLEFWRANHLLAPFAEAEVRCERGSYGGRAIRFLGLADLIRSKETERASDWQDVTLLEEIQDARRSAAGDASIVLAGLRSRRGFESALARGWLSGSACDLAVIAGAVRHPVTWAYLTPFLPFEPSPGAEVSPAIRDILTGPIRRATGGSGQHLALVEAVRRLYRMEAMAADRANKQAERTITDPRS